MEKFIIDWRMDIGEAKVGGEEGKEGEANYPLVSSMVLVWGWGSLRKKSAILRGRTGGDGVRTGEGYTDSHLEQLGAS